MLDTKFPTSQILSQVFLDPFPITDLLMKYEEYDGYLASSERMGSYPDLALAAEDMKVREDMVTSNNDIRVDDSHARLSPGPLTHYKAQHKVTTTNMV